MVAEVGGGAKTALSRGIAPNSGMIVPLLGIRVVYEEANALLAGNMTVGVTNASYVRQRIHLFWVATPISTARCRAMRSSTARSRPSWQPRRDPPLFRSSRTAIR